MSNNKIKILYVESLTEIGGAQIGLIDILRHLDKNTFSPVVIIPSASSNLFKALLKLENVEVIAFKFIFLPEFINKRQFLPIYSPFSVTRLANKIKSIRPDLVHANHIFAGKYAAPAAKKAGIPCIITIRNVYYNKPLNLHKFVDTRLVKNADHIVFNSNTGYEIFKKRTKANNVSVIRNGIELNEFRNQTIDIETIIKQYNLPTDKKLIVTIGRLSFAKGQTVLIHALPKITAKRPDCHVVFVGSEDPGSGYKKEMQHLAEKLNVLKNISWIEFTDNVSSLYKIAYITVLPSILGEGLPRVIIESMALGTPPIASNIAGTPELIKNNSNGYLFKSGDVDSLTKAILNMLSLSSQEYNSMCELNKKIAREKFDIKRMMNEYINLYRSLAKSY